MQNTSLCDVSTTHDADDDTGDASSNEDESPAAPRNKRKKTNGECVEEGLRALAEGVKLVGEAMKAKTSTLTEASISRDVLDSLTRQETALQRQTAAILELIYTLRGKA
ncbi:uncharacterized protein IUM83_19272 [Phytophthora cinnamomi]|uniref:uncharacterized protein n=1 Tax=Phytophthora cinnamomi TaxID=4785 RepID=UPI00355A7AF8|nr:hypothetical protein IUM83_19272 [Phytophthora cinnamomi]